jgi:hypothetical protein
MFAIVWRTMFAARIQIVKNITKPIAVMRCQVNFDGLMPESSPENKVFVKKCYPVWNYL